MDRAKKERRGIRMTITRIVNEVALELVKEEINKLFLRAKFQRLEQLSDDILRLDREILDAMLDADADEKDLDDEQKQAEEYIDKILLTRTSINDQLDPEPFTGAARTHEDAASTASVSRKFKLPKIELKKFNGELKEWLGWWAQFSKIDEDESLDPTDKFQYLFQATVAGSKAREVVDAYPQSAQNYPKVIDKLKERFGKDKLLKQMYVRELLKLVSTATKGTEGVSTLYYALDSHTRALASLGVTTEQSADFLYPMVESCLPEELLVVWQRHGNYLKDGSKENPPMTELSFLLEFLRVEVENEEQRKLAKSEGSSYPKSHKHKKGDKDLTQDNTATSAGLYEGKVTCLFCARNHQSHECLKAMTLSLEEKRKKVSEAKGCFVCFKPRPKCNGSKFCKAPVRCSVCAKKHYHFMCPELPAHKAQMKPMEKEATGSGQSSTETSAVNSGIQCHGEVLLKTVLVRVIGKGGVMVLARLLFDEGSQTSYITSFVINKVKSTPVGEEWARNVVIDGTVSNSSRFFKHYVTLQKVNGTQRIKLPLMERPVIGGIPPRAQLGKWQSELQKKAITIEDHQGVIHDRAEIDILIGSDFREQLMTGRRTQLSDGVFAVESTFGWMLCGPVGKVELSACEILVQSYLTGDISQLWNLDVLGIQDSAERITNEERDKAVKESFLSQVTRDEDGRYVVKLPWINDQVKSYLPTNESVSVKRLETSTVKLDKQGKFKTYDSIFRGWEEEGIIEVPDTVDLNSGHYLPHRPVFKDSLTTPVRPVFDASCRVAKKPSLNQCLEKGPNWLELIPAILLRFRRKKIEVISDIRKAFQMISVAPEDRKYQKFYWWNGDREHKELKPYQHCRVVFGLTCSPFILAAILDLHLSQVKEQWKRSADLLKCSLYVDNCVTSFDTQLEYVKFKSEAIEMLAEAKMELRQWECQFDPLTVDKNVTTVLGLKWNKVDDTLYCQLPKEQNLEQVTKRVVLSVVAQIFEPIGYACPALLKPKLMLQEAWASDLGWDDNWDDERRSEFLEWYSEVEKLGQIQIPRCAFGLGNSDITIQFHAFGDASQKAYAGVVFVRVSWGFSVSVQLIAAKARVAPLDKKNRKITIPRLELLGCLVSVRLLESSKSALNLSHIGTYLWSDSTTALSWIRREGDWGAFVGNRVKEIVKLTGSAQWRHVPGTLNPADLPSRGCSPSQLLASKWWEGPDWLTKSENEWPACEAPVDEDEVNAEVRKTTLVAAQIQVVEPRFSSYLKNVRVAAWIRRFINNSKSAPEGRVKRPYFTKQEMDAAEVDLIKVLQERHFGIKPVVKQCDLVQGDDGLIHVKSRLLFKTDTELFRKPILLPGTEPLVQQLIVHIHRTSGHPGTQFVLGKLRERYWITRGKKTVGNLTRKCVVCKRHRVKCLQPETAPLPKHRVETFFAFQTTGVDLAGPLTLKGGEKAWIVLYTCAVYRGIHLDLVTSLSTVAFLDSLERFVNLIGRPNRIYSDNGTNFVGAKNLMKLLNWEELEAAFQVKEIEWTFNPPASPWWGGWWERLVRSTKELLRRMLGTAKLTNEELRTCLASASGTLNDRPLTTLTEDGQDLIPLTPRMFMRDLPVGGFPDGAEIGAILPTTGLPGGSEAEARKLRLAYKKLQVLKEALRARFRKEYLGMLVQKNSEKPTPVPKVGDVVLIGQENKKRFEWPLGRIEEVGIGADGKVRVAKLRVANRPGDPGDFSTSILTRPLQRLYPLEMASTEEIEAIPPPVLEKVKVKVIPQEAKKTVEPEIVKTRKGRQVKRPQHYGSWNY